MATQQEKDQDANAQSQSISQREALNDAYAALLGQQSVQSFTAFTFEEALDAQIERIEGAGTQLRPNQLGRVDRVEQRLLEAVEQLKQVPPEMFRDKSADQDVNTEPTT